jgi:hypothetical protein
MFSKKITDGDEFTALPPTTQCLYFHLCMSADDDGFSNSIRVSLFNAHATNEDFNTLVRKRFIIPFESGVIVIKHWKIHNYIQTDRYHETKYLEEKSKLILKENGVYTERIQDGYKLDTEVRDRIGKDSIGNNNIPASVEAKTDKDADYKTEFEELWILYPKKHGKQNALRDYIKARKSGVERNTIEDGLSAYIKYCERTNRFFKDGSTWFHQHSWDDDYEDDLSEVDKSSFSITEYARQMQEEGYL